MFDRTPVLVLSLGLASLVACGNEAGGPKASSSAPAPQPATTATAEPKPTATATATAEAEEEEKEFACGEKGEPLCPMQSWMKKNIAKAVSAGDLPRIAKHLQFIADHTVEGYDDWTEMAEAGVKAAEADDLKAAKKSCKPCHKAYQKKWRKTRRDEAWP